MKHQSGFTLIELMIAVIILTILAGVAVPSLTSFFAKKNVESTGKIFEQTIRLARSEAVNRGVQVQIRPSNPSDNWTDGWEIFFTNPTTGAIEVIRTFSQLPSTAVLSTAQFSRANPITILPSGQATSVGSFTLNFDNCNTVNFEIQFDLLISGMVDRRRVNC